MVHAIARHTIIFFTSLYIKKIEGIKNLPEGPFIFAANHASYIDDFVIPLLSFSYLKKKVVIFVNSLYHKYPFLRSYLLHYNCIPLAVRKYVKDARKRKATNKKAFAFAKKGLKEGKLIGIFPEGTRSKDGKLQKAKIGVAQLALEAGVPVVPIGIKGSFDILPPGRFFPRFKRCTVKIGKPLYFKEKKKDYKTLERVTTKIMKEIAKLIDQSY
ncbi:1-acyl-sn-glycerol-3-phosphate acyltransferase [Candidatus Woesearchaeota archaeon]|nr:1-acyl-sn-glycerol-3-phosphate acyltransferase [Candidatus Woesearchaeota archaeon]